MAERSINSFGMVSMLHGTTLVAFIIVIYRFNSHNVFPFIDSTHTMCFHSFSSVKNNPPGKDLTKEDGERMIVGMLVNGLVEPVYRFNAYG